MTPTGESAPGIYVRGDAGSFNTYRGLISAGIDGGRWDAWGAVSADTSDGDRDHSSRNSYRFHGNLGYDLTDTISTRFYLSLNNINQELPGALNINDVLNNPTKGNFVGDQARDINSIRVQNQTRFQLGEGELALGAWVNSRNFTIRSSRSSTTSRSIAASGAGTIGWATRPNSRLVSMRARARPMRTATSTSTARAARRPLPPTRKR